MSKWRAELFSTRETLRRAKLALRESNNYLNSHSNQSRPLRNSRVSLAATLSNLNLQNRDYSRGQNMRGRKYYSAQRLGEDSGTVHKLFRNRTVDNLTKSARFLHNKALHATITVRGKVIYK